MAQATPAASDESEPSQTGDAARAPQPFKYIAVLDFEATCHKKAPRDFVQEIIEFPVVLVDTERLQASSLSPLLSRQGSRLPRSIPVCRSPL